MGLNGISVWQWCVILVVFVVAIVAAPGIARAQRASQRKRKAGTPAQSHEQGENND